MFSALLTVSLSIVAGASLAFFGLAERRRLASSIDSFALIASLAVVLGHLLPHAIASIGLFALLPFALALFIPALLERAVDRADHAAGHGAALELSYIGLLAHQFGDGLGLGVFSSGPHEGHLHLDLMLGVGAHTIPIATLMTSAFLRQRGARSAALRAAGLIAAGVLGVALASRIPGELLNHADPWISAAVGGLLLHIVLHDPESPNERQRPSRFAELLALSFGIALLFLGGGYDHSHGIEGATGSSIGPNMLELLGTIGGPLTLGFIALYALERLLPSRVEAIKDALSGVVLPAKSLFLTGITLAAILEPLAFLALTVAFLLSVRLGRTLELRELRHRGAAADRGLAAQLAIGILLASYLSLAELGPLPPFVLMGALALALPRRPLLLLPIGVALAANQDGGTLGPLALGFALNLAIDLPALFRARSPRLVFGFFLILFLIQLAALGGPALILDPPALPIAIERSFSAVLLALFFASLVRNGTRALLTELVQTPRAPERR